MVICITRLGVKRAFTLIELLIVVAIIAILAAVAVPNFQAWPQAAQSGLAADPGRVRTFWRIQGKLKDQEQNAGPSPTVRGSEVRVPGMT